MKKSIYSYFKYIVFVVIISLASCTDDIPVKPEDPIPPDTIDLYSWRKVQNNIIRDLYAVDTSNIYICGYNVALKWDGSVNEPQFINFNDNNFRPQIVDGFDISSVFFGGSYGSTNACIKRVMNDVITETYYFDSAIYINHLLPIGQNEIWISAPTGMIAHYKNGQIIKIYLPKLNYYPEIFNYKDGNLYVFAEKPGNGSNIPTFLNCYKIENEQFIFIRSDSLSQNTQGLAFRLFQIGKDIVMYDNRLMLMRFTGNDWINYSGDPGFYIWGLGGNSIDSMIAFTWAGGASGDIHTWNGNRWRKEIKSQPVIGLIDIDYYFKPIPIVGNNVYVMLASYQQSYLLIGRRKEYF
jgi:hypothetical protein